METGEYKEHKMFKEFESLPTPSTLKKFGIRDIEDEQEASNVGSFKEFESLPTANVLKRFGVSAIGYPFRTAASLEALPNSMLKGTASLLDRVGDAGNEIYDYTAGSFLPREEIPAPVRNALSAVNPLNLASKGLKLAASYFPSTEENLQDMKEGMPGQLLPKGSLEGTGPIEKYVDATTAGALPFALTGGMASAAKAIPGIAGMIGAGEVGHAMGLGPTASLALEGAGMATGNRVVPTAKWALNKLPGYSTKFGRKAIEVMAPGSKPIFNIIDAQERENLQLAQQAQKEKVLAGREQQQKSKVEQKRQSLGEKEFQRLRKVDLAKQQEALEALELERIAKEKEIKAAQDKHNQIDEEWDKQLEEKSKADWELLKSKQQEGSQLDKQVQETIKEQSKAESAAYKEAKKEELRLKKEKLKKASKNKISKLEKEHKVISQEISDIKLIEDVAVEHFGATPEVLRGRAKRKYQDYESSIPDGAMHTANKLETLNTSMRNKLEAGFERGAFDESSKKTMLNLIDAIEAKIKDGQIKVKDLAAMRRGINEQFSRLKAKQNMHYGLEKEMTTYNKAIDQIIDDAGKKYPKMKTSEFHEANTITRNLYESKDYTDWSQKYLGVTRQTFNNLLSNPEYQRLIGKSFKYYAKGEMANAAKILSVIGY